LPLQLVARHRDLALISCLLPFRPRPAPTGHQLGSFDPAPLNRIVPNFAISVSRVNALGEKLLPKCNDDSQEGF
jgi:hypothetical protein